MDLIETIQQYKDLIQKKENLMEKYRKHTQDIQVREGHTEDDKTLLAWYPLEIAGLKVQVFNDKKILATVLNEEIGRILQDL